MSGENVHGVAYLVQQDPAGDEPYPVLVTTDEALATAIGARLGGEHPVVRLPLVAAGEPPSTAPPGLAGFRLAARPAGEEAWNEQLRALAFIGYDLNSDERGTAEYMAGLLMALADVAAGETPTDYHVGLLLTAGILEVVPGGLAPALEAEEAAR